jgi:hypothetical protein
VFSRRGSIVVHVPTAGLHASTHGGPGVGWPSLCSFPLEDIADPLLRLPALDGLITILYREDRDEAADDALANATGGAVLPMDPRPRSMVDALYRQHAGFVQSKLARRDIGPASARDLHPQVFVTLGQQVQKHGLLDQPEAMLFAITEHKIRNDLRQKKRRPTFARAAAPTT